MTNKKIKEYRRIISKETCKEKYGISADEFVKETKTWNKNGNKENYCDEVDFCKQHHIQDFMMFLSDCWKELTIKEKEH